MHFSFSQVPSKLRRKWSILESSFSRPKWCTTEPIEKNPCQLHTSVDKKADNMESLFTLAIFLQVLLPYSISSQKIGCIDGRQQSILARELEHWNCIPLGKSTSQKGPQWKQMDFLPLLTIGCQTQAASRTGFFCKLLLRQSIHLNKIFFFLFFKKKFF